jgi:hypothetical protein
MKDTNLDGKWATVIPELTPDDTDPAIEDLDKIVDEYSTREDEKKAPVVLGSLAQGSQGVREPVGRIDEVRRKGNSLEGKFGAVDPRVDYLQGRGAFPKKSVRIMRTQDGVSLDSVGLIRPTVISGVLRNDQTPSLDELMKQHTGVQESAFGEQFLRHPDYSGGYIEICTSAPELRQQVAANAISELKKRGRWSTRCDRAGLPALFAEVAGTPSFNPVVDLIGSLVDQCDPSGELLSECAKYYARQNGITFSEALDAIGPCRRKSTGDRLTDKAYALAAERNIDFGEALSQVAEEYPELTGRRAARS